MFFSKNKPDYKTKCEYLEARITEYEDFINKCRRYKRIEFIPSGCAVGYTLEEVKIIQGDPAKNMFLGTGIMIPEEILLMRFV